MTIKQKATLIVKSESILFGEITKQGKLLVYDKGQYPLLVTSEDPTSRHYPVFLSNTGMLDYYGGDKTQFVDVARKENTMGGLKSVVVEKEIVVNDFEYQVELNGFSATTAFVVDEKDLIQEDGHTFARPSKVLKPGFSSVSQTRKGDMSMIPGELSRRELLISKYGFRFSSYTKISDGKAVFDVVKNSKRIKLAGSSGERFNLFDDYEYQSVSSKEYKDADGDVVESNVYSFLKDGNVEKIEYIPEDFGVKIKQEVLLPVFSSDTKNVGIEKRTETFFRPATDGAGYIDAGYAAKMGLAGSCQFRFTPVGKGMLIVLPGLKKKTGSTMILFDGSVKGSIDSYLKDSKLDFFILNKARRVQEKNSLLLSRQVFGAISLVSSKILDGLVESSKDILERAYNFEEEALSEFVGIEDSEAEEEVLDIDNLTATLFAANKEGFLKSSANKKKLASLVRKSTREMERGAKLYLNDASIKHMVVDPFTIMDYLSKGIIGVDAETVKQKGIRGRQFITSAKAEGFFYVEHEKAFLARYPFLHYTEGQLVNADGGSAFLDDMTAEYYSRLISKGFFQGLGIYSLWDMVPEGQSGADFDGDTTVYTTNSIITDNFGEQPLFLDYSILDGELVEGVPWKEGGLLPTLEQTVGKDAAARMTELGVEYNNGKFTYDSSLIGNPEVEEVLADAMANVAALTNQGSNIGQFTNINSSVMELESMLDELLRKIDAAEPTKELQLAKAIVKKERNGYKKLSLLMACAIRWEIDKAKHGGAFMNKLSFLSFMVEGTDDIEALRSVEDEYGVSLERLFVGNK